MDERQVFHFLAGGEIEEGVRLALARELAMEESPIKDLMESVARDARNALNIDWSQFLEPAAKRQSI